MKTLSTVVVCGIIATLIVMFLAEQDLFKAGFQNPLPAISSWYQSVEWPWTETPAQKAMRIVKEDARKEQILSKTIQQEVFVLSPGETIRRKVGEKYRYDVSGGEYQLSFIYQGRRIRTVIDSPGQNIHTGDMTIDELVFHQDPRYPYGDVVITLKTTPPY